MRKLFLAITLLSLFTVPAYAWKPIANTTPQYVDSNGDPYSGAVLKAYTSGTTTNITMAIDSAGTTPQTSIALNANGYPAVSGTIVIPYVDEAYKLSLYPTQAAADSDTGAIWTIDALSVGITFGESSVMITTSTVLTSATHCNAQLWVTGTSTLTLPAISSVANNCVLNVYNGGSGLVTIDADGSETVNGALTWVLPPLSNGQLVAGDTSSTSDWAFNGSFGITQSIATGDIYYASTATSGLTRLPVGTKNEIMSVTGGLPGWKSLTDWPSGTPGVNDGILFQSGTDGTINFTSFSGLTGFYGLQSVQVFTTPGDTTYTKPSGINHALAIVIGGGGGGGGADSASGTGEAGAGGGGGGACGIEFLDLSAVSSEQVSVGAAGTAGASTGTTGGTGGTSGFLAFVSSGGGAGGVGTGANSDVMTIGGVGGTASGGDLNITGNGGTTAAGDNLGTAVTGGTGGGSCFGGGGVGAAENGTAGAGGNYGGGGGGGADGAGTGNAGGTGSGGAVYVLEFAN